jgi:hypothetical protein
MSKQPNKKNIIEPVSFNFIKFSDDNKIISYTDCFEISLLRFLQCAFVSNETIDLNDKTETNSLNKLVVNLDRMKSFTLGTPECTHLIDFFTKNQKIELDEEYYQNDESDGYKLRTDWCIFLNKRPFFKYKKDDKYELCASLHNLFTFFNVFLPKLNLEQPTDKMKLIRLATKLSTDDLDISISLKSKITCENTEYYYTNDMNICINNINYNWHLYQYFENDNGIFGDRITGHSELSLC